MSIVEDLNKLGRSPVAMNFNGVYLETVVPGYITNSVTGRDDLDYELKLERFRDNSGKPYKKEINEPKKLSVTFTLLTEDNKEDFIAKKTLIKKYLNVPNSKIIFDDDPNYYWFGAVEALSYEDFDASGSGYLATEGTISIVLAEQYKYKNGMTTVTNVVNGLNTNIVTLTNSGTEPTPIFVEAVMSSKNSYLGFSLDGRNYQIGTVDINKDNSGKGREITAEKQLKSLPEQIGMYVNSGVVRDYCVQEGSWRVNEDVAGKNEGNITPKEYGSYSGDKWHGPTASYRMDTGLDDWCVEWRMDFNDSDGGPSGAHPNQVGDIIVNLFDTSSNILASVDIWDRSPSVNVTEMDVRIKNDIVYHGYQPNTKGYVAQFNNYKSGSCIITKIGNKITFSISNFNIVKTFTIPSNFGKLNGITLMCATWGNAEPIKNNLFRWFRITRAYDTTGSSWWLPGDKVIVDNYNTYINNIKNNDSVDIGSRPLMLYPGTHQLGIVKSDFASMPLVTVKFRERCR